MKAVLVALATIAAVLSAGGPAEAKRHHPRHAVQVVCNEGYWLQDGRCVDHCPAGAIYNHYACVPEAIKP